MLEFFFLIRLKFYPNQYFCCTDTTSSETGEQSFFDLKEQINEWITAVIGTLGFLRISPLELIIVNYNHILELLGAASPFGIRLALEFGYDVLLQNTIVNSCICFDD